MPREQTQFKPGQTGNPGGRPKGIAALARQHAEADIDFLAELLDDETAPTSARIQAARELLDRGYGKPVAKSKTLVILPCQPHDTTVRKQQMPIGRPFQPGQSGNPKGRPEGARNKLGEQFLNDMLSDWLENGVDTIRKVREDKPDVYLKVVASILPTELNVKHSTDDLTDEQLVERIRVLDAAIRPFLAIEGEVVHDAASPEQTSH